MSQHEIIGSSKGFNRIPDLRAQLEKQYEAELRQKKIDEIRNRNNPQVEPQEPQTTQTNLDKDNYIFVPEINLYIAKQRTHLNKDWNETHQALNEQNLRMPTIPEFISFLNHLRSNKSNEEYQTLFKEITEVRNPWRANWLDAKFSKQGNKMFIAYNHYLDNQGNLQAKNQEELTNYLTEDRKPGINLTDWLSNHNKFGLPLPNSKHGDFYYWYPTANHVMTFGAVSDCALLGCDGGPSFRGSDLGVFACAEGVALENSQPKGGKQ